MLISTGKLIYGVVLEPHCRFLFIPWVKSNGYMRCLKVRNFGSSIPVRYIPKNSPKPRIPLVSNLPKNAYEEQVKHTCLDPNVGGVESSYGTQVSKRRFAPRKPPNNENSRSLVAPVNEFHEISRHGSLESDVLGLESVDGGNILARSFGSLDLNDETEVDEELGDFQSLEDTEELVREITGKETSGKPAFQSSKSNQDAENTAAGFLSRRLEFSARELGDFQSLEDTEELVREITGKETSGKPAFQSSKSNQDAENTAAGFLSRRALTTVELRKKLIAKRYPLHVVDQVITKFQIRKFLDDFQYAEAFSRSRFSSLSWGPGRIKQALRQKGVSEADAEKAIKLVFKDGESGEDQSRIGLSNTSLDQLFAQASKRWLQSESQPVDKRKSKIIQWLRYRGYNWGVVNVVLKKLESAFPP